MCARICMTIYIITIAFEKKNYATINYGIYVYVNVGILLQWKNRIKSFLYKVMVMCKFRIFLNVNFSICTHIYLYKVRQNLFPDSLINYSFYRTRNFLHITRNSCTYVHIDILLLLCK